jgi:hypothetical protein
VQPFYRHPGWENAWREYNSLLSTHAAQVSGTFVEHTDAAVGGEGFGDLPDDHDTFEDTQSAPTLAFEDTR